jgi:hypothetical protein
MKKLAFAAALTVSVVACGGIATTDSDAGGGDAATDAGASKDATGGGDGALPPPDASFDAGSFCTGSAPRAMINGVEVPVASATGKAIVLNCCDSAELTVATAAYQALFDLLWRAPAAGSATIDLANPPQGFSIELDLGCDPATTSCATANPEERYVDGFSGTLQYGWSGSGMTASYCVQVDQSPSQPHALIHSMLLYAPNVSSP